MKVLYKSTRSATLWFVWVIAITMLLLTIWLVSLLTSDQLVKDFGAIVYGRFFQFALVLVGSIFIWPMIWMSQRYVLAIEMDGQKLQATYWTVFGRKQEAISQSNSDIQYNQGKSEFSSVVNAPYLSLRINERKVIIDMQGEFPNGEDALIDALSKLKNTPSSG